MRLPPLFPSGSGACVRLPLSIGSAEAISAALLTEGLAPRHERFAELLRGEPPLVLWCILRAGEWTNSPPKSVGEVADWLADQALSVLRWDDAVSLDQTRCLSERQIVWTRLFDAALEDSVGKKNEAQLFALLRDCERWLAESREAADGEENYPLPSWLASLTNLALVESAVQRERVDILWNRRSTAAETLPLLVQKLSRLAKLEADFADTLEREKLAALKELAYGASHEINNPLANISTRAQALLRDEIDPERRRKLATINSQAFRAHEMISDMMLFAKPPRLVREQVDVVKLVDLVIGELHADAREQGTTLMRQPGPESLVLSADAGQLAVALKALASNALEAIGSGGRVEFAVRPVAVSQGGHSSAVEIVVADTGPGISPEVRRHLFDPFYSGREAGRGLGFGLAKCWRVVTDHGGQIEVASETGRGATLTVRLPHCANG